MARETDPAAHIQILATQATFYLSATSSYDPDAATTGLTSHFITYQKNPHLGFRYSWSCEQLVCPSGAKPCPGPCKPRLFGVSRDKIYPVVASFRTDDFEVGINGSLLERGAAYRVYLSISRQPELLPAALQGIPAFTAVSNASLDFTVVPGAETPVAPTPMEEAA